jgi:hypothetical protein
MRPRQNTGFSKEEKGIWAVSKKTQKDNKTI